MESIKIIEWNLHGNAGRGGKIPYKTVMDAICMYTPDIAIFTEFSFQKFNDNNYWENRPTVDWPNDVNDNWSDDAKEFYIALAEKGYKLFITDLNGLRVEGCKHGWNGIGIAVKNELCPSYYLSCENDYRRKGDLRENSIKDIREWKGIPDYLIVKCCRANTEFVVIGTRVRTAPSIPKKEYETLLQLAKQEEYIIIAGDLNNGQKYNLIENSISEADGLWYLYTPQNMRKDKKLVCEPQVVYSHKHPRYKTYTKIDHLITNFDAKISSIDKNKILYDWDYEIKDKTILDHAILYAEITLPE